MVLMARQPIWGLGSDGFRDSMQALADSGRLTQSAAQFGKGETHDQLLAYTVDYGLIGGVALMAIYVVPGLLFWRCVRAQAPMVGRAGLMGLVFVVSFWIFGLSVETFDLKAPTAFYATVVAVLAGIAAHVLSRPGAGGNASR
jgi:O-antigen ligase